ncbi:MAG: hypothetical protein R3B94_09310 [Hyphomonas sp.]
MKYLDIRPGVLWSDFGRNAELTERIYEHGMDRVSGGGWFYINPATGFGIFEDAEGNFLFMETKDQGAESRIVDMHCGLKVEGPSDMAHFIDAFVVEFGLARAPMEDA